MYTDERDFLTHCGAAGFASDWFSAAADSGLDSAINDQTLHLFRLLQHNSKIAVIGNSLYANNFVVDSS
jgi:hypothetical protein